MARLTIRCDPFAEGTAARLRAQWPREDDVLFQQSDFTPATMQLRVYDLSVSNTSTAVYSNTRGITAILTNTPFTWDWDSTGYNFHDNVLVSQVTYEGGHTYRFEYVGTRDDGTGPEQLAFEARAKPSSHT